MDLADLRSININIEPFYLVPLLLPVLCQAEEYGGSDDKGRIQEGLRFNRVQKPEEEGDGTPWVGFVRSVV